MSQSRFTIYHFEKKRARSMSKYKKLITFLRLKKSIEFAHKEPYYSDKFLKILRSAMKTLLRLAVTKL